MVTSQAAMPRATDHILYLVHDLADPAVRRRILMLQEGGAQVTVAGFRRPGKPPAALDHVEMIELGVTHDARMAQRAVAVARACLGVRKALTGIAPPSAILARNLEMLAIANVVRGQFGGSAIPLIYEVLDIHGLLLREDRAGRILRGAERHLGARANLTITSSPAFIRNYFQRFATIGSPILLVENRHLEPQGQTEILEPPAAPPWRIGWFGAIRCRRSLEILSTFTRTRVDQYECVIRGIPSLAAVPNFETIVSSEPGLYFGGAYRNPDDIASIYSSVHFSWAIDLYEELANSEWLLPNRLYEGSRFGTVPIVLARTETGRFLADRGLGIHLREPSVECLEEAMLTAPQTYASLRSAMLEEPTSTWIATKQDCLSLMRRLVGSGVGAPPDGSVLAEARP